MIINIKDVVLELINELKKLNKDIDIMKVKNIINFLHKNSYLSQSNLDLNNLITEINKLKAFLDLSNLITELNELKEKLDNEEKLDNVETNS